MQVVEQPLEELMLNMALAKKKFIANGDPGGPCTVVDDLGRPYLDLSRIAPERVGEFTTHLGLEKLVDDECVWVGRREDGGWFAIRLEVVGDYSLAVIAVDLNRGESSHFVV